ncbi:hypothetical protein [Alkalihalobacillus sp. AL-G]|uniref:hypothetical protein n=1 Tax=Alkalihalobacillus sp. AL-G TaxID=2926399 RepID=UPI00272CE140|nr:hypothetical protein [Alkalihalobacillus sp. AL-G]WLD93048.1 hypothetical protein MOJ78_18945 [Alkalihalobacillus sp. AL-G]
MWLMLYFLIFCICILSLMSFGWFIYAYKKKSWKYTIVALLFYLPMTITLINIPLEPYLYLLSLWNLVIIVYCLILAFQVKSKKKIVISFLLLILFSTVFIPIYSKVIKHEMLLHKIENTETPVPLITVNSKTTSVKGIFSLCWEATDSCIEGNNKPYLLPIDPLDGIKEFKIKGKAKIHIGLKNSSRKIKNLHVYYFEDKKVQKITIKDTNFILPSTIPEQAVRVTVEMEDTQKFSFNFGIRNGNRP